MGRNQVVEINPKVERQSGEMMIGPAAITRKMNREPSKRLECRKKGGSVSFLVSDFSKEGTKERYTVVQCGPGATKQRIMGELCRPAWAQVKLSDKKLLMSTGSIGPRSLSSGDGGTGYN